MVIYTPLYLAQVGGFSLYEIGLIMFVGLSAYVIFEYPIGIIADTYIGEKKMMAFGFLLLAISTSWFAFLPQGQIGIWMFAMFVTRVGASFVEATSESYFFKHTGGKDADAISLFRMTRPLSSLLGAGLGSIALLYMDFNLLFIILGFLMVPGLFFTLLLKDTK
jgi:MFS family permease